MTNELAEKIPKLYTKNHGDKNSVVYAKLFLPNSWEWYITEYDNEDLCFGLISGFDLKFGYFSLKELEGLQVNITRDEQFREATVSEVIKSIK